MHLFIYLLALYSDDFNDVLSNIIEIAFVLEYFWFVLIHFCSSHMEENALLFIYFLYIYLTATPSPTALTVAFTVLSFLALYFNSAGHTFSRSLLNFFWITQF